MSKRNPPELVEALIAELPHLKLPPKKTKASRASLTTDRMDRYADRVHNAGGNIGSVVYNAQGLQALHALILAQYGRNKSDVVNKSLSETATSMTMKLAIEEGGESIVTTLGLHPDDVEAMHKLANEGDVTPAQVVGLALRYMNQQLEKGETIAVE